MPFNARAIWDRLRRPERRNGTDRRRGTTTVRELLKADPDMAEICLFYNPENNTWSAYPVGIQASCDSSPDCIVTRPTPEAAMADVLALEVSPC